MKTYFYGDIVQGEELEKTAKERQKGYREVTTLECDKNSYLSQGWKLKKKYKRSVRLYKKKEVDELLEDKVWLLFKNMGFKEMNKDRNFKVQAGHIEKQIYVFAKDDNNVFVTKCIAQSEKGLRYLRKDIHEILNLRNDITKSVRKHYGQKLRVSFLLVTKNVTWSSTDEKLAYENRRYGFFFWKETDLESYTNLTNQLGASTRFQMYNILFFRKKIPELGDIEVPAIYGGKGKNKYYSFIIQPEKLLQVAYVHRREESNPEEVSGTYQRMLKKGKLDKICKFINGRGFFPNNIILNFTVEPIFDRKAEVGDIVYGILKFPRSYGSAWVIDGQHRLFGYSETVRKAKDTLTVVAFVKLKKVQQARLFVEINKEQTPVSSNLLWDLYPDIYYGIEEEKYQILRAISLIVKKLNFESDSPFHRHINIPSVQKEPKKGVTNLTMASVCEGLKENRLIKSEESLLYRANYENTVDFASEIIKAYFKVIAESFPQDWKKGQEGLLRTNIGIRIFLVILRQFIRYLRYQGLEKVYTKKELKDFKNKVEEIIGRVLVKLKEMPVAKRDKIRKESSKGWVLQNTQMLIWDLKEEFNFGLELWRKGGWAPPVPEGVSEENIKELIKNTEMQSKKYLLEELTKIHGEKWWVERIPEGVKQAIKGKMEQEVKRFPPKKEKINSYSDKQKFEFYSSTSDLKEIIKKKNNWGKLAGIFGDMEYTSSQFKSLEVIRNVYIGHEERKGEIDEIEKNLGYWGTKWIRRCIGLDKIIKKTKS